MKVALIFDNFLKDINIQKYKKGLQQERRHNVYHTKNMINELQYLCNTKSETVFRQRKRNTKQKLYLSGHT